MLRQIGEMEDLINGKIRKRGCSSSASSSSSIIQNYRLKKAVLVGRRGGSSTPVPTWRLMSSRSPSVAMRVMDSPKYAGSQSGKSKLQAPVSARKLAATLWEMNEIPSPGLKDQSVARRLKKEARAREKTPRSVHSGSLPPHLSDPSHSPVSERTDRSGTGSHRRRTPSVSHKLRPIEPTSGRVSGSLSHASLMEIETRSRAQTPRGSTAGAKPRLKDVSNALTTSKELLKIINRIWGHEDRLSSNMSLISALHAELERARLLVNQLIQEHRFDENEINYLMKRFAEEKAAWKSKERKVVEAAIESVVGELEVERKLRRRFESLNKKLGKELADAKDCLVKTVKELESEKRTREIMEQVCDELAGDIHEGDGRGEGFERESNSVKVHEEAEKEREREMMELAEVLRQERNQVKLSEAQHQVEEKNAAISSLRKQLEAFLGTKRGKGKGNGSALSSYRDDDEATDYFTRARRGTHCGEEEKEDAGEVVNGIESPEGSIDSELHSIELDIDNNNKRSNIKWGNSRRDILDEELRGRKSSSGKTKRNNGLQRSISDGVEWGIQNQSSSNPLHELDWERIGEQGYLDEMNGYKSVKGLRDRLLSAPTIVSPRASASPIRQWGLMRPSREPSHDRPPVIPGSAGKSRLGGEVISRKAKR